MKGSISFRLVIKDFGRPVEINILMSFLFSSFIASMVEGCILCVSKDTKVPSISKNAAFIVI